MLVISLSGGGIQLCIYWEGTAVSHTSEALCVPCLSCLYRLLEDRLRRSTDWHPEDGG